MKKTAALLSVLFSAIVLNAQVRLPAIIRDSMILQRGEPARIWGWASPGEKIRVVFKKKTYSAKADSKGNWSLDLAATAAGGPYTIEILSAKNKISLREVLFGDVFFCSGQSNMVHQLNIHDVTYAKEIAAANNPAIRQFRVPNMADLNQPQNDIPSGNWQPAVGEQVRPFSAVAYFFALKIHEKYNVPVGIINSSYGGTPIDAWTSEEGLRGFPAQMAKITENRTPREPVDFVPAPLNPKPVNPGLDAKPAWYETAYQPKGWRPINVPGYWEDQGIRDLDGVVWYRKTIQVPEQMVNTNSRMHLGRIVDADELYINGKKVGATTYLYPQRRYHLPAGTFKKGENIVVIRVTNNNGKGGFVPDKPYELVAGNDTIDLKGTWQYKVETVFQHPGNDGYAARDQNQPSALFNAMVAPFINYTIKAVCWYQGESDTWRAGEYRALMPALINDWRRQWAKPSLPFVFVQLPGFMEYNYLPSESSWAQLRESQAAALEIPHTAMAVAIDLGEWNDVHPENKKDVGERMALGAFDIVYHENLVSSGPLPDTTIVFDDRIEITFRHTGSGLTTKDGEKPGEFAIAGADKKFKWADARIEGNKVIVRNTGVFRPLYVRYAWADNPVNPNLINREGLPASPFRTDK